MTTTSKGGRPATGSIEWRRNAKTGRVHWHARITLNDGTRAVVSLDPRIAESDRAGALACARMVRAAARKGGFVAEGIL